MWRKNAQKVKLTQQKDENYMCNNIMVFLFTKKKFLLMIYLADRAILMSIFDNDQISSKLAQTQYFVYNFYGKKIFILGSLDNAENIK